MTHEELLAYAAYDPDTGVFTSRVSAGNRMAGSVIGNPDTSGYLRAVLMGRQVKLHRLAWFYFHGQWPTQEIDHINRIKTDNRIANLRECDTSSNCTNQLGPRKNNKLGLQGVHLIKHTGRYRATCVIQGKRHSLGIFATAEAASATYKTFKEQYLP